MRGVVLLVAVLATGVAAWWALAPAPRWVFRPARAVPAGTRLGLWVWQRLDRWLAADVRAAADALGWPPWRVGVIAGLLTGLVLFVGLLVLGWPVVVAAPGVAYVAWRYAGGLVLRQYRVWQAGMVQGLPTLIAVLRVHIDLGRTVQDALSQALLGVQDPLQSELHRVLTDMHLAATRSGTRQTPEDPRQALFRLAARVARPEFSAFADTLGHAWSVRLTGAALVPLQDLLRITRERQAEEQLGRLDTLMTTAPGFAIFGLTVWLAGGFLLSSLTGTAGFF